MRSALNAIYSIFCLCFIILCLCGTHSEERTNVLARIGQRTVTEDYFITRYREFLRSTGGADNGQARRAILNNIIAEELLILDALRRNYDNDAAGRRELKRIKIQELLNAYHRRHIGDAVTVNNAELKKLYVDLHMKVKASHLYAPTLHKADSLYAALQNGATFEELARDCFDDPMLRDSGGSLGYFGVDEMHPAFEEAAFSLAIGEISAPVRTNDGYSIIRVEDRVGNPFLTESDFAVHRPKLEAYWKKRKTRSATKAHGDSLRTALAIRFDEATLDELLSALQERRTARSNAVEEYFPAELPELEQTEIVVSSLGTWDLRTIRQYATFTSPEQQGWIRDRETFKDFLAGLVVRAFILKEARNARIQNTKEYAARVREEFDISLLERIHDELHASLEIPEDTLRAYYEKDRAAFAAPPLLQLREIVLADPSKAAFITGRLSDGVSFSQLARRYSVSEGSAQNGGDLGYLTPGQLGRYAEELMAMKIGEVTGPIEINSFYVFFKCEDKLPPRSRSFAEAKHAIETSLRPAWLSSVRQSRVEELKRTISVKSYPDKLLRINLKKAS